MAEKDFKEFVTDLCSDISWKDIMRKWGENLGVLIPYAGQYFAAGMSTFEHEIQLRAIKKLVDAQDDLKELLQDLFDDFWREVRKYERASYPFKIFNVSQIEEIRGELNWNPEFVNEYLPIRELEGVSLNRNILLRGKIGIGKTRNIFKLMEGADIETIVVVKEYVRTLGVDRFENLLFQGKTVLIWDDVQNSPEEFLKALPYLKTKSNLLIVAAIRSTDYGKIEKDANIREGKLFTEIDLELYEAERMERFVRLCEREFRKPLTDTLRRALVEKAVLGDSTPLYVASIFLKENQITGDVIERLPADVVNLWSHYFRELSSNEKCFMKALRAAKLGLAPPFKELVEELYLEAFFGERRDLADTIASLKSEHWIVEIPDYYVCLDVQLECFQFEDADMRHFLECLFKKKLVLEYHLQLLLGIGSHYYESEDYDFAIKLMNRALELNRDDSQAWHNKGLALGKLGRYEEEIKCFDEALKINPLDAIALNSKGLALENLGRYEEEIKCFDEALKIDPQYADAWYNKGVVLENLGRHEDAIKCFDEALKINPLDADAWYNKGIALGKLGGYEEAIKCFDEALKINPQYAKAWYNKGVALENLERYEEALTCFNKANTLTEKG